MTQLSKHIRIEDDGESSSIVYQNKYNSTSKITFNDSDITVSDVKLTSGTITGATLTEALGANATPLTRTNNPIVALNKPNVNIDVLDAAIGENGDMHEESDAKQKIVSRGSTIYANLEALSVKKSVNTIRVRVGAVGLAGCDFNFTTANNTSEQVITLTTLPAKAKILEILTHTSAVFTGATTLVAEIGTTSSGHELMDSTTCYAADALNQVAADHAAAVGTISVNTKPIYMAFTPGANWNAFTAGSVDIYITYIDIQRI